MEWQSISNPNIKASMPTTGTGLSLKIKVIDGAGNEGSCSLIYKIDRIAPIDAKNCNWSDEGSGLASKSNPRCPTGCGHSSSTKSCSAKDNAGNSTSSSKKCPSTGSCPKPKPKPGKGGGKKSGGKCSGPGCK